MNKVEEIACGCGKQMKSGRKAVAVDPEIKTSNLKRLRRIEGQIRGLQRMVDEEYYCADILVQISSVQEALRGVGRYQSSSLAIRRRWRQGLAARCSTALSPYASGLTLQVLPTGSHL